MFFRQFEEKVNKYTGYPNSSNLLAFVKPLMVETIFEFNDEHINTVFSESKDTIFLFRKEEDNESAFQKEFEIAAKFFKGQGILFSYAGSQ